MGTAAQAITAAKSQLGVPYQLGAETPGVAFDCSGLMQWSCMSTGTAVPWRTTQEFWQNLPHVFPPLAGDIAEFEVDADGGTPPQHCGMYLGANQMIEAPHTGESVQIVAVPNAPDERLMGFVRPPYASEEAPVSLNGYYVRSIYGTCLGRGLTPAEYATQIGYLNGGGDPEQLYINVEESPEGQGYASMVEGFRKTAGLP